MLILFLHRIATISHHHPSNPFLGNRSWSNAEIRQLNRFVPESITLNPQHFHSFYFTSKFTFVTVVNMMASDYFFLQQILLITGSNSKVWPGYWPKRAIMHRATGPWTCDARWSTSRRSLDVRCCSVLMCVILWCLIVRCIRESKLVLHCVVYCLFAASATHSCWTSCRHIFLLLYINLNTSLQLQEKLQSSVTEVLRCVRCSSTQPYLSLMIRCKGGHFLRYSIAIISLFITSAAFWLISAPMIVWLHV